MTTNVVQNGDFASGLTGWTAVGNPTPPTVRVVNGTLEADIVSYETSIGQAVRQWPITLPVVGNYWLQFRAWASAPATVEYELYTGASLEDAPATLSAANLSTTPQVFTKYVGAGTGLTNRNLQFGFNTLTPFTFYLDDVWLLPENLVTNGEFDAGQAPWVVTGATSATVSGGQITIVVPGGTALEAVTLSQPVPLPGVGSYSTGWRASSSLPRTIRVDSGTGSVAANLTPTVQNFGYGFEARGTMADNVLRFNLGGTAATFVFERVNMFYTPYAATISAEAPSTVLSPVVITLGQLQPGARVVLTRTVDGVETRIATLTADASGTVTFHDHSYPFGVHVTYTVYNSTQTLILATYELDTPDSAVPWLRDTFVPELLNAPTAIVDITGRVRGGRVTVYRVVGQKYPVTLGDIRQASEGTMTVLCRNHAERDDVINTLSSGYPCSLRVPSSCRAVIDDMLFTPLDIMETRFGTGGACTLAIDFVEVLTTDLPQYVATTYATQTANAAAAGLLYQDLTANFAGLNYAQLYLSADGINPS